MKQFDMQEHRAIALRAADSAESVLGYFEASHSQDARPRRAIEAGRAWAHGELTVSEARVAAFAAHAAARDAGHASARFAARAAGHAAATAHVATHAPHAAAYAAKAEAAASDIVEIGRHQTPNTSLEPTGVGAGGSAARLASRVAGGSVLGR